SLALGLGFLGVGVETALVLGLAGNARFQKYVDAQRSKELRQARQGNAASPEELVQQMLHALPKPLANRFDALRRRCLELRSLAQDLRDPDHLGPPRGLEELQLAGLDRLLWIYLRLLYTQSALERFMHEADDAQIRRDIHGLEERLQKLPADNQGPQV